MHSPEVIASVENLKRLASRLLTAHLMNLFCVCLEFYFFTPQVSERTTTTNVQRNIFYSAKFIDDQVAMPMTIDQNITCRT